MADEAELGELLSLWERERSRGRDVTVADLCRGRPDLAPELGRRLEALRRMSDLAQAADRTAPPSGATEKPAGAAADPTSLLSTVAPGDGAGPAGPLPSLPGYEVLGELGRGGMGVVYRATDTRLKRPVALKMVLVGDCAGPEQLARFRAEAEAAARLQHPGIVQVYEVGEHHGRPYMALELVEGGTLARKLAGAPLPPRQAAGVVRELALAVEHAHRHGVLHRDLKPANVLLADGGAPKVSDFGLAKLLDQDAARTQTGAVLGTPSYMAPEQAAGRIHDLGPATDVYALGAILYEALTGRPPFKAPTVIETLEQARSQEPVPPGRLQQRLPRSLEVICLKCLEKEPRRRYASAGELAEDLRRFLADEPILARPPGWAARFRLWSRRPERIRDAGAFMAFVGVVGSLWCASGLAFIYAGQLRPPHVARALTQMTAFIVLIYVPLVFIGRGTMARRRLWLWAGAAVAATDFLFCLFSLIGSNPVGDLFDLGGLHADRHVRYPVFSLLGILMAVQLFGYCVALRAYYANRHAVR